MVPAREAHTMIVASVLVIGLALGWIAARVWDGTFLGE